MSFLTPEERERQATLGDAERQATPGEAERPATQGKAPQQAAVARATQPPTLADVAQLTPDSDYTAYTAPGVDAQVRNEALRKLFLSDPHFQQPDELDVRIDEVISVAQSPLARQHKIRQARALGLLDDELLDQGGDEVGGPDGPAPQPR